MTALFRGVGTALATPMNEDFAVDYDSYRRLVQYQLDAGVNALIVAGTTGEGSTLTTEEKLELLKITLELRGDKDVSVILGTGANNTATAIENTRLAKENGADAALVVTPYYNKTSQRGLVAHYYAIADTVDIPIIVYNVPGRTGMTVQPETVVELSKHKNIVALKDATGDMKYLSKLTGLLGDSDFTLLSGDDGTLFDFIMHGGHGVISVISNVMPKAFLNLYALATDGKVAEARNLQDSLNPFIGALFSDVSPTPLKPVLNTLGLCRNYFRLPLIPTTAEIEKNTIAEYEAVKHLEA